MIARLLQARVRQWLGRFPAVAILGPRQCDKSTLAGLVLAEFPGAVRLDLERLSHGYHPRRSCRRIFIGPLKI